MIQAKNLRIGNLVEHKITDEFDDRKEWWEVSEIDTNDIHWLSKVDGKDQDYRPIKLSEEILLKCGFEKKFPFGYRIKKGCYVKDCLDIKGYYFRWNGQTLAIVDTVDQLQNLYFCLCGKELNVNL